MGPGGERQGVMVLLVARPCPLFVSRWPMGTGGCSHVLALAGPAFWTRQQNRDDSRSVGRSYDLFAVQPPNAACSPRAFQLQSPRKLLFVHHKLEVFVNKVNTHNISIREIKCRGWSIRITFTKKDSMICTRLISKRLGKTGHISDVGSKMCTQAEFY